MPGPAAKWDAARRNSRVGPLTLRPYGSRDNEPTPEWPIPSSGGQWKLAEEQAWVEIWKLPQADEWERAGIHRIVARYIRMVVEAELPGAEASARGQVTNMEDRLGLTPKAMRALLWEVPEAADTSTESAAGAPIRRRIQVKK